MGRKPYTGSAEREAKVSAYTTPTVWGKLRHHGDRVSQSIVCRHEFLVLVPLPAS